MRRVCFLSEPEGRTPTMARWIALLFAFLMVAGCGPSERTKPETDRTKGNQARAVTGTDGSTASATADAAATESSEVAVIEIGTFQGICDHTFSGINDQDVVALANASGLRSFRLAGIAIPAEIRAEAHAQLRSWLEGQPIGVEVEAFAQDGDPAAHIYRCSTKTLLNADLVSAGLAVVADVPSAHRDALSRASMEALSARRGVWGKPKT